MQPKIYNLFASCQKVAGDTFYHQHNEAKCRVFNVVQINHKYLMLLKQIRGTWKAPVLLRNEIVFSTVVPRVLVQAKKYQYLNRTAVV